jgi:hypothetical protein
MRHDRKGHDTVTSAIGITRTPGGGNAITRLVLSRFSSRRDVAVPAPSAMRVCLTAGWLFASAPALVPLLCNYRTVGPGSGLDAKYPAAICGVLKRFRAAADAKCAPEERDAAGNLDRNSRMISARSGSGTSVRRAAYLRRPRSRVTPGFARAFSTQLTSPTVQM